MPIYGKYIIESNAKTNNNIPKEILDFSKELNSKYKYGVVKNGKVLTDLSNFDFFEDYKSLSLSDFEKYRVGVCWDYCHYEANWFKDHGYRYETYYIQVQDEDGDCPSHTFILFYLNNSNKVYYFESSWYKYRGIEEFDNASSAISIIKDRHIKCAESKCDPKTFISNKYDAASKSFEHLSCAQFITKATGGKVKFD